MIASKNPKAKPSRLRSTHFSSREHFGERRSLNKRGPGKLRASPAGDSIDASALRGGVLWVAVWRPAIVELSEGCIRPVDAFAQALP